MNLAQFLQALQGLVSVPEGERGRAVAMAKILPDAERLEFLRYLQEIDERIGKAAQLQEEFNATAGGLVAATERKAARFEREGAEQISKATDMNVAEGSLSQAD